MDKRTQERESHNWNSSGCTVFLLSVTTHYTNTDAIVISTLAQFCGILSQIREGDDTLKLHMYKL